MALKASDPNVVHQATTRRGKRRRSKSPAPPPNKRKTVDKTKAAPPSRTRNLKAVPLLNPLPSPPTHARPSSRLFFWGSGDSGQLGMGDHFLDTTITKPRRNTYMEQQAEAGAFGGPGAGLESVAAGSLHSAVIDENGTIWTFGAYDNAELGRKTIEKVDGSKSVEVDEATSIPFYLPVPIQCLIDEGFRAVNVVLGDCIGVALGIDGQLRAWGAYRNHNGPLGFSPNISEQCEPTSIPALSALRFSSIAAGGNHVLFLTTGGEVYSAGSSEYMQLGRRVLERRLIKGTIPERVILQSRSRKAILVGTGADHSFAVDENGTAWGWGLNGHGQTGTCLPSEDRLVPTPLQVHGMNKTDLGGASIVQISGGSQHTLFLTSDGRVFACGNCQDGQLGLSDDDGALSKRYPEGFVSEPTLVPFPDQEDPVVYIACGTHNSLAITQGGAMYSWGRNTLGQLGTGTESVDVKTPTMIVRKEGGSWSAKAAACGSQHSLALLAPKNAS